MEKARTIISANLSNHNDFEQYFPILEMISINEISNPDICIESCKALIEGVSKTILINLDNTKNAKNLDEYKLPKLFKDAMIALINNCIDIEAEFLNRLTPIVQVIGETRNKRSDISHGREAPKPIVSSTEYASTVKGMTENIIVYILSHYYSIDMFISDKLDYESDEMIPYNLWLDESLDFPIKKINYSQVLYENDYDEYEIRYSDEYLTLIDEEYREADEINKPHNEDGLVLVETKKAVLIRTDHIVDKSKFTQAHLTMINQFAENEKLDASRLIKLIDTYIFDKKIPLRDTVVNLFINKPKLKERKKIPEFTEKIINLINQLEDVEVSDE